MGQALQASCCVYRGSYEIADDEKVRVDIRLRDYGMMARIFQIDEQLIEETVNDVSAKRKLINDIHRISRVLRNGERGIACLLSLNILMSLGDLIGSVLFAGGIA